MDAFAFITGADSQELLATLKRAQCRLCFGTGERNDAEPGDISFASWVCPACNGKGWNTQAVREIIDAA